MKRTALMSLVVLNSVFCAVASEVSLVGTSPITKPSTTGIALNMVNYGTGGFQFDTDNLMVELFYRKCEVESFDWGFTLGPMPLAGLPGSPQFLFDLKTRIFKGKNIIPSFSLGVDMVRVSGLNPNDFSPSFTFLDEGRMGLSWEFVNNQGGSSQQSNNMIYAGVNVIPGGRQLGDRTFVGAKFGNLNLTIVFEDEIRAIGFSYCF